MVSAWRRCVTCKNVPECLRARQLDRPRRRSRTGPPNEECRLVDSSLSYHPFGPSEIGIMGGTQSKEQGEQQQQQQQKPQGLSGSGNGDSEQQQRPVQVSVAQPWAMTRRAEG